MNSRGLKQEPWRTPTFILNSLLRFAINMHSASGFHACSVWVAPATTQRQVCEEPTRLHVWVHDPMPFPDWQRPCTMSCWLAYNGYGIGSSQPHSPEPLWPGLTIWGLDIFLAQGPRLTLVEGNWLCAQVTGLLFKKVLPMTRSQDMANSSNLSSSVFLVPQPCLPCTPSYPALDLSTWPFQSTKSIRISGVGISATTGRSLSKKLFFSAWVRSDSYNGLDVLADY